MKTLVIGDIHGCYTEMLDLLERAAITSSDQIIALGDMVDRGPDSHDVVRFFQSNPQARALLGNHERKHIHGFHGAMDPATSQEIVRGQLAETYPETVAFFKTLPVFMDLPEAALAHGIILPGVPLEKQPETVLVGSISGERYMKRNYARPWYELYDGPKPAVAGHRDYSKEGRPTVYGDRVFLIDTGCCYGRYLTGLLLPDFRLISVKSRRNYWGQAMQSRRRGQI